MVWHNLDRHFYNLIELQTFWGKIWYTNIIFLRLFVILVVGAELYEDEQEHFRCDTMQPGCVNVCYNEFSPISHIRFWGIQIMVCAVPVILFHHYALSEFKMPHEKKKVRLAKACDCVCNKCCCGQAQTNIRKRPSSASFSSKTTTRQNICAYTDSTSLDFDRRSEKSISSQTKNFLANNNFLDDKEEFLSRYDLQNHSKQIGKYAKRREEQMPLLTMSELVSGGIKKSQFYNLKLKIQRKIRLIYILHCLTKLLFESVFIVIGYRIQVRQSRETNIFKAWHIPEKYLCLHGVKHRDNPEMSACSQQPAGVSCWVSRPQEKEYFVWYMLGCQIISIVLILLDIVFVSHKLIASYFNKNRLKDL